VRIQLSPAVKHIIHVQ